MTPGTRLALAFAHYTGTLPSGLHIGTRMAAGDHLELVPYQWHGLELHRYQVKESALAHVLAHPLAVACEWFKSRGFTIETRRGTSHFIAWRKDGFEGYAYRHGGGTLTVEHGRAALPHYAGTVAPFRTSFPIAEAESAFPAILRPGMYAGERLAGEHGRTYLERALSTFRNPGPGVEMR